MLDLIWCHFFLPRLLPFHVPQFCKDDVFYYNAIKMFILKLNGRLERGGV